MKPSLYYVSLEGNDSTGDGLSIATAFATISKAQSVLGAARGAIQLLSGTYPAPIGGLILGQFQSLFGIGAATVINGTSVTGGCVVGCLGGYNTVHDLAIVGVPASGVGLRISLNPTAGWNSTQNVRISNVNVAGLGSHAMAYGIGDDTAGDVSDIVLTGCRSEGRGDDTTTHMQLGGGIGNVLDITIIGGDSASHAYGLIVNGAGVVATGVCFEISTSADIWLKLPPLGAVVIASGRSESALRFLKISSSSSVVSIRDYDVVDLVNTDGQAIQHLSGPICYSNIFLQGRNCPQYIVPRGLGGGATPDSATAAELHADSITSEHPHPFMSPWSRPGRVIRARNLVRTYDINGQFVNAPQPTRWVRRVNIPTNGTAVTVWPRLYDALEMRLAANCGLVKLPSGDPGQRLSLCFDQDNVGGHTYDWPSNIAWSGGSDPIKVTAPRTRQHCELSWTGDYWEQRGTVINTTPPSPEAVPVTDNFTGVLGGGRFFLGLPDGGGTRAWEQLPGGGSFGILGGLAAVPCLGWVGDAGTGNDSIGLVSFQGSAAVIETGMTEFTLSATFVWQAAEGVILHCSDDQTFLMCWIFSGGISLRGYARGVFYNYGTHSGPTLVPGSTHTLTVKRTAGGGIVMTVDPASQSPTVWSGSIPDLSIFGALTKHGIFAGSRDAKFTQFTVG